MAKVTAKHFLNHNCLKILFSSLFIITAHRIAAYQIGVAYRIPVYGAYLTHLTHLTQVYGAYLTKLTAKLFTSVSVYCVLFVNDCIVHIPFVLRPDLSNCVMKVHSI